MSTFQSAAACVLVGLLVAPSRAEEAKPLAPAELRRLHKELTTTREPWQDLPWHLAILAACEQAAKEKKPVYMLCRSGHPLGCV